MTTFWQQMLLRTRELKHNFDTDTQPTAEGHSKKHCLGRNIPSIHWEHIRWHRMYIEIRNLSQSSTQSITIPYANGCSKTSTRKKHSMQPFVEGTTGQQHQQVKREIGTIWSKLKMHCLGCWFGILDQAKIFERCIYYTLITWLHQRV